MTVPPPILQTTLMDSRKPRRLRTAQPSIPTSPNTPIIHVHIPDNPHVLANSANTNIPVAASALGALRGEGLDRQYAFYLDTHDPDSDGDHEDSQNLDAVLTVLHARYPACNFPQYENPLRAHGIHYLVTAGMFDSSFYTNKIGMNEGAASLFCESVTRDLYNATQRRRSKGKKRARIATSDEAENEPPVASGSSLAT